MLNKYGVLHSMSSNTRSILFALLREGIQRVNVLMRKGKLDQAYVLIDLLANLPTPYTSGFDQRLNEFLEHYPDEKMWIDPIRNHF